jgi:hypothetical protein
MVDAVGATQRLHHIVLAWDYWDINEKLDEASCPWACMQPHACMQH